MELSDLTTAWAIAALRSATPLLLVLLGELMTQRTGIINLGVEGQMLVGACAGFALASITGDPWTALLIGAVAGATLSLVHAGLCLGAHANQIGSGVAVWMLGLGLSAFFGRPFVGAEVEGFGALLADPDTGVRALDRILGQLTVSTVLALALVPAMALWLYRSRAGRRWRAVGESQDAARALGLRPKRIQLQAILLGGLLSGLAGAILSVDYTQTWAQDMTKGQGLVAVALVIVARWNPWMALPVALLFGGAEAGVLRLQAGGVEVSSYLLASAPYLLCIAVVALGYLRLKDTGGMPAELVRIFR